jgi:hypothetical protein
MPKANPKLSKQQRMAKVIEASAKPVSPVEAPLAPIADAEVVEANASGDQKPAPTPVSGDQKPPPTGDQKTTPPKKKPSDVVAKWRAQKPFDPKQVVKLLRPENPKRRGAGKRFAYYRDGMSVQAYIDVMKEQGRTPKATMDDMRWDHAAGFIKVE